MRRSGGGAGGACPQCDRGTNAPSRPAQHCSRAMRAVRGATAALVAPLLGATVPPSPPRSRRSGGAVVVMRPHHDRLANAPQRPAQLWRINALGRGTWPCGVNPAHGPSGTLDSRSMLRRASERGEMGSRMCVGNAHSPGATQVGTSPEGGAAPRRWLHGKISEVKRDGRDPWLVSFG